jgi:ADP-ribose pyrophosphatase YjhB (NUDIX family)
MTGAAPHRWQRRALGGFGHLPKPARRWVARRVAPSFTVGCLCVVERADGRVLLVRHAYAPRWGLPGGFLKRNESPAPGARREVREEVGLDVELLGEPAVVVAPRWRRVDVVFRARPRVEGDADGVRVLSGEILAVEWFPRDALPELQEEAAEALIALARIARGDLGGSVRLLDP